MQDTKRDDTTSLGQRIEVGGGGGGAELGDGTRHGAVRTDVAQGHLLIPIENVRMSSAFSDMNTYCAVMKTGGPDNMPPKDGSKLLSLISNADKTMLYRYYQNYGFPLDPSRRIGWCCAVRIKDGCEFAGEIGIALEVGDDIMVMRFEDFITRIVEGDVAPDKISKLQKICDRLYPGKYSGKYTIQCSQESGSSPQSSKPPKESGGDGGKVTKAPKGGKMVVDFTTEPPVKTDEYMEMMKITNIEKGLKAGGNPHNFDDMMRRISEAMNEYVTSIPQDTVSQNKRNKMAGIAAYAACNICKNALETRLTDVKDFFYAEQLCEHELKINKDIFASLQQFMNRLFHFFENYATEVRQMQELNRFGGGIRAFVTNPSSKSGSAKGKKKRNASDDSDDDESASDSDDGIDKRLSYHCAVLDAALNGVTKNIVEYLLVRMTNKIIAFCMGIEEEEGVRKNMPGFTALPGPETMLDKDMFGLFQLLQLIRQKYFDISKKAGDDEDAYLRSCKFIPKDLDVLLKDAGVADDKSIANITGLLLKVKCCVVDGSLKSKTFDGKVSEMKTMIGSITHEVNIPTRDEMLQFLMEVYPDDPYGSDRYTDAMAYIKNAVRAYRNGEGRSSGKKRPRSQTLTSTSDAPPSAGAPSDPASGAGGEGGAAQPGESEAAEPKARRFRGSNAMRELGNPQADPDFISPGKRESKRGESYKPSMGPVKQKALITAGFDIIGLQDCSEENPVRGVYGPCFKAKDSDGQSTDLENPELGISRCLDGVQLECIKIHSIPLPIGLMSFVQVRYPETPGLRDVVYKTCLVEATLIQQEKKTGFQSFCCIGKVGSIEMLIIFDGRAGPLGKILNPMKLEKMKECMRPPIITPGTEQGKKIGADGQPIPSSGPKGKGRAQDSAKASGGAGDGGSVGVGGTMFGARSLRSLRSLLGNNSGGGRDSTRRRSGDPVFDRPNVNAINPSNVCLDQIVDAFYGDKMGVGLPFPGFNLTNPDEEIQTTVRLTPGVMKLIYGKYNSISSCSIPMRFMYYINPMTGCLYRYQQRKRFDVLEEESIEAPVPVALDSLWKLVAAEVKSVKSHPDPDPNQSADNGNPVGEGGSGASVDQSSAAGDPSQMDGSGVAAGSTLEENVDVSSALEVARSYCCIDQIIPFVYIVMETEKEYPFSLKNKELDDSLPEYLVFAFPYDMPVSYFAFELVRELLLKIKDNKRRRLFGPVDLMVKYKRGSVSTVDMTFETLLKGCRISVSTCTLYHSFLSEICARHELKEEEVKIISVGELCNNPVNPLEHLDGICKIGVGMKDKPLKELFAEGRIKTASAPFRTDLIGACDPVCHHMFKEPGDDSEDVSLHPFSFVAEATGYEVNNCTDGRPSVVFARNLLTQEVHRVHHLPR